MKNRRFLSAVLIVATVLLFVSCGGLASTKHVTGSFEFAFNTAMLGNTSRTVCDGFVIKAHLYSNDGTYDKTQRKSFTYDDLFDDEEEFRDPPPSVSFSFDEIPLHTQMLLKIDCSRYDIEDGNRNESDWLTTVTKRFTLTSSEPLNLESKLFQDITTPLLINYHLTAAQLNTIPSCNDSGILNTTEIYTYEDGNLYHGNAFCFFGGDEYSYMKLAYLITANSYYAEAYGKFNVPSYNLQSILYDPVTTKLCVVYNKNADGSKIWKAAVLDEDALFSLESTLSDPSEYGRIVSLGGDGKTSPFSTDRSIDFDSKDGEGNYIAAGVPIAYAYDGFLYTLRSFDQEAETPSITLCKFSLKTGSLISSTTVSIPRVAPTGSGYKWGYPAFSFNDIAVADGRIYILIHQQEFWVADEFEYSMYYLTEDSDPGVSELKPGYVDRGAIYVYDADTLKKVDTLGMAPVKDSITVKFTDSDSKYFIYRNYNETTGVFSNPVTKKVSIKWAVPAHDSLCFANPLKIVAIMPKKLVIVDSGSFMYDRGGWGSYKDIDNEAGLYEIGIKGESRLITVDLENFADSTHEGYFNGSYYGLTPDSCFLFSYSATASEDAPLYAKQVWKDQNNQYHTEVKKETEPVYASISFSIYNPY